MKQKILLICLVLFFYITGFPQQEIRLSDITKPGDNVFLEQKGVVLAELLVGPRKAAFSGNAPGSTVPVLSKEEQGKSGGKASFDKLAVLFSGKIYSPNMAEPIIFENKTPEELVLLELSILPNSLEPYTLFMDLSIRASSKPIGMTLSDDAGVYRAVLNIVLVNF